MRDFLFFEEKELTDNQKNFLKHKAMEGLADNTLYGYVKTFKVFNKECNLEGDITSGVLDFFYSKRNLNGGYNGYRKRLFSYFKFLVDENIIESNPILEAKIRYKKENAEPRPAKKESLKKILDLIDLKTYIGFRDYVYVILTIDTGVRPNEAVQITKNLFDFKEGTLKITPNIGKCHKSRILPLSYEVLKRVQKLLDISFNCGFNQSRLFLSNEGEDITTTCFQRRLQYYSDLLKLEGEYRVTPYMLRHYFATTYLENGGNVVYLQYLMGHSDIKMTKKYLKINQESVAEEHKKYSPLNEILMNKKRVDKIVL